MRSMMRDFTFVSCLLVVALMLALAWRGPFVHADSARRLCPSCRRNRSSQTNRAVGISCRQGSSTAELKASGRPSVTS